MLSSYIYLFWISVIGITNSAGQETQIRILPLKSVVHVIVGSNFTVYCEAIGLGDKLLRWHHSDKQVAFVTPETVQFSNPADKKKYLISTANSHSGNFSLTVLNFDISDSGFVFCDAADVDKVGVQLEALSLPTMISLDVETSYRQVKWNHSDTAVILNLERGPVFSCKALNGRPEARITWFWDGRAMDMNEANVTDVAENDGELYNVTSFLEISSNLILSMGGGGISEPVNVTSLQFESTVENITSDNRTVDTIVTKVKMPTRKQSGTISCRVLIANVSFAESKTILFAEYYNSGCSGRDFDWKWIAALAMISRLLMTSVV